MFDVTVKGFRVKFISLWSGLKVRLRYALIVFKKVIKVDVGSMFLKLHFVHEA